MEPSESFKSVKKRVLRWRSLTTAALRHEPENNQPLSSFFFLIQLSAGLTFLEDKTQ